MSETERHERNIEGTACLVCGTLGALLGGAFVLAMCALGYYLQVKGSL